jgi:integrase
MPRPRWPHLLREVPRHGTVRWVVRVGHRPRIPLKHEYGTPEFAAAYHAAIAGEIREPKKPRTAAKSLRWLVERWYASSAWAQLKLATQNQRRNIVKHVLKTAGDKPYKSIATADIVRGRERRAGTPSQANNFLNTMRALFRWAVEHGFVAADPTDGVRIVKRPKTGGFPAWMQDDVDKFKARWPLGTRERVAFELLRTSGFRRGDIAGLGRQHLTRVGGALALRIRTEKNGRAVVRKLMPEAAAAIEACPATGLAFVAKANGEPLKKESFGNWFGEAARAAGVRKNAHGLRKLNATALTNAGSTEAELEGAMGWTPGSGMARIYTRERDDELLAARATAKLEAAKMRTNDPEG